MAKPNKYFRKFEGWASHEGQVQVEAAQALEEFLVNPASIPPDCRHQVTNLFNDWFLFERRLTRSNLTPLELFLKSNAAKWTAAEADIYHQFNVKSRYGLFRVEEVDPGTALRLRHMPGSETFDVREGKGSESAHKGMFLVARLAPFEDHWIIVAMIGAYPADQTYAIERALANELGALKAETLRPRHFLRLFLPKTDWVEEGLPRVKARLAMILQRWGVADITVGAVEKDILEAHANRELTHPMLKTVLSRAPSRDEAAEATSVLTAFWNLTLPGDKPPRGPQETKLLADMGRWVMEKIKGKTLGDDKEALKATGRLTQEWLDTPQAELGGQTPMQVIEKERASLGNPRKELGVSIIPTSIEIGPEEQEGARLANLAQGHLSKKEADKALECLQKAYAAMKGHPDAFRVLGNMATAYVMLGRRSEAVEMLPGAQGQSRLRGREGQPPSLGESKPGGVRAQAQSRLLREDERRQGVGAISP